MSNMMLPPPLTVTQRLRWLMRQVPHWSQLEALEVLIETASEYGHTLYSGDGRPIPRSSYLPRKGGPSGSGF
jgi:hypothetical protein